MPGEMPPDARQAMSPGCDEGTGKYPVARNWPVRTCITSRADMLFYNTRPDPVARPPGLVSGLVSHMPHTVPSRPRLFFGHQSVGRDVLTGLEELGTSGEAVPTTRELNAPQEERGTALLLHACLGRNAEPQTKLAALAQWLEAGVAGCVDHAMLKFCYVDIANQAQAEALYEAYFDCVSRLRQTHPGLRIVHSTVPLRWIPDGPYAAIRRLLGHRHAELERNSAREWFNERLRSRVGLAEPIFDIARIQSTRPDGSRCTHRLGSARIPSLVREYTFDGGHLNAHGRRIAASAFLRLFNALESH
jgi:hypothetical protein